MPDEMRESPAGLSQFGLYEGCPRKWAFKYALGYQKNYPKHEALIHGSAVHEGMYLYYVTWDIDLAVERAIEVAAEGQESFLSMKVEEERLDKLFRVWYAEYGEQDQHLYAPIELEVEDRIELPNGGYITVRRDRVFKHRDTGHIYIFDTKTTGWSLEGTVAEYEYKPQPLLYVASVYRSNPAWISEFRGWITDVIYQRVNYKRDGSGVSSMTTKCQRSPPIIYSESECNSYLESLTTLTSEVAWAYTSFMNGAPFNSCFRMNRGNCRTFGRTCPYWSICMDSYEKDSPVPNGFTRDEWHTSKVIPNVLEGIKS